MCVFKYALSASAILNLANHHTCGDVINLKFFKAGQLVMRLGHLGPRSPELGEIDELHCYSTHS